MHDSAYTVISLGRHLIRDRGNPESLVSEPSILHKEYDLRDSYVENGRIRKLWSRLYIDVLAAFLSTWSSED